MQFFHECAQIFDVPPVATVTIQQAVDTSIRCIPVSIAYASALLNSETGAYGVAIWVTSEARSPAI